MLDESIPDVPLVSDLLPMAALRAEYENGSAAYRSQIDWLVAQGYTGIRRARGTMTRDLRQGLSLTPHSQVMGTVSTDVGFRIQS
jgi:Peptidase C65 Otubain